MAIARRMPDERGFTLVELMTVVLIIGILAAMAMASYSVTVRHSRRAVCKENQRSANSALAMYASEKGQTAGRLEDIAPYLENFDSATRCTEDGRRFTYDTVGGTIQCTFPGH